MSTDTSELLLDISNGSSIDAAIPPAGCSMAIASAISHIANTLLLTMKNTWNVLAGSMSRAIVLLHPSGASKLPAPLFVLRLMLVRPYM